MARLVFGLSLALLLLFFSCSPLAFASPKKPVSVARREDIPFIKCQVCEKIAREIHNLVQKKEALVSPKKVSEFQIIEIAENVCNLKKEEADWILRIDVVEKGDKLELVDQGTEGQCNSECKTIERACQEVMGYSDTDVAEYLYKSKPSVDALIDFLCNDLSKACSVKPPPVPKDRVPGEPFVAKSSKEAEMEKILKSMEGMPGAPNMKMYSREDLMNMNNFGGEDDDEDDEDDEDEDDKFPANLGKILKEKDNHKKDFKQTILQGISETKTMIKSHINKVSGKVKNWLWSKKVAQKTSKAGKAEL
ncbi:nucleophosmin [Dioscorea cayenensis subsp. rotundata]|uniref:Nucleophosmin n=1 Tax=Dioscorea cayennensis subsp. rotundata TaxID=55577 RepID=A0AB40CSR8_DIOCR|nr:nucleophosmin [Dioscorea cayenensis subsp. rotundata]